MQDKVKTNQVSNSNRLLSRKEVARCLRISESTLAAWQSKKNGHLPVVKVGRLVRYRICDLQDFIQSRTIDPASRAENNR